MIIIFQVVLLFVMVISFMGVIAEKDKSLQEKMLAMFLAGLTTFVVSVLWL